MEHTNFDMSDSFVILLDGTDIPTDL